MKELTGRERTTLAKLKRGEESFWRKLPKASKKALGFDKFVYAGLQVKAIVICPVHSEIEMRPDNLLQGKLCNKCVRENKPINAFVSRNVLLAKVKGNGIKLPLGSKFRTTATNIDIECKIHGTVTTRVAYLIDKGICNKCGKAQGILEKQGSNTEEFITKSNALHNYDYSKVVYTNAKTKVTIICDKHGPFSMTPNNHLSGKGCPSCGNSYIQIRRNGKAFVVQGYEPQALDYMLSRGIKASEIECYSSGKVPLIRTKFKLDKDRIHKIHRPDFYIPKLNLIVEVKSLGTFGLEKRTIGNYTPQQCVKLMQHKSKKAKAQGFKYTCLLMTKAGDRIKLPENWDSISTNEIKRSIRNL